MKTILTTLLLSLVSATAFAEDVQVKQDVEPETEHQLSLTIAPLWILNGEPHGNIEVRVFDKWSGSLGLGYSNRASLPLEESDVTHIAISTSGQIRYYAIGDFDHGMQVGAHYHYFWTEPSTQGVKNRAVGGHTTSGFLGYKYITDIGFTLDFQGGIGYFVTSDRDGQEVDGSRPVAYWAADIGWSF
jgi:hypothetical protein